MKYGFRDGIQRYKCLNCNRTFIKQSDKKQKSLTENEKYLIDKMLGENISYRAKICVFKKKLTEVSSKFNKIIFKINSLKHEEIDFIDNDEIYSWVLKRFKNCLVKNKKSVKAKENNYSYIFTTLIYLKNGNKIPFFSIQNNVQEENLNNHFELIGIKNLNKVKIYSDNAKMYQSFDFIQKGKNKFTNKIERSSLNFQIRNKVSFLRRKALTFAKKIMSLNFKLMIFMNSYFQKNYKHSRENLHIQNQL